MLPMCRPHLKRPEVSGSRQGRGLGVFGPAPGARMLRVSTVRQWAWPAGGRAPTSIGAVLPSGPARAAGLGVGLAVVRLLVEQSGGTLTVDSGAGQGTTFVAMLPLRCR